MSRRPKNLICANLRYLRHLRLLFLLGCLAAASAETKPSGFQGLGPLLGQAPSIPPPPLVPTEDGIAEEGMAEEPERAPPASSSPLQEPAQRDLWTDQAQG